MNRFVSLVAMATVVALISFVASRVTAQPVWLAIVLISSGVLAAGFIQSLQRGPIRVDDAEDGSSLAALSIRFTIGALTLACMTASMIWFAGLAAA